MRRFLGWLTGLTMWPMLVKEFIQLRRDRPTVAMMGIPPATAASKYSSPSLSASVL